MSVKDKTRWLEIFIFVVFSSVFAHSVYRLFRDERIPSQEQTAWSVGRSGASAQPVAAAPAIAAEGGFVPYETRCQATGESMETSGSKLRVLGPLCGLPESRKPASEENPFDHLKDYSIQNTTNRYAATVFIEAGARRFSTDFIPLEPGANAVELQFHYKDGTEIKVPVQITRKPGKN